MIQNTRREDTEHSSNRVLLIAGHLGKSSWCVLNTKDPSLAEQKYKNKLESENNFVTQKDENYTGKQFLSSWDSVGSNGHLCTPRGKPMEMPRKNSRRSRGPAKNWFSSKVS